MTPVHPSPGNLESPPVGIVGGLNPSLRLDQTEEGQVLIHFSGDWVVGRPLPSFEEVEKGLSADPRPKKVQFDAGRMGAWDSVFLTF
jgi:hypothetical protein